jgi:hypothetical protein
MTVHPQRTQADHRPYIELVRLALLLKDVHIGVPVLSHGRLRSAEMTVLPPDDDFDDPWHPTFANAERAELRWSEEDGWSLLASYRGAKAGPTIWRRGFGVLLPPEEVAGWLDVLLTMPHATPSREDGPFRSHQRHDHTFEAVLAAYAH